MDSDDLIGLIILLCIGAVLIIGTWFIWQLGERDNAEKACNQNPRVLYEVQCKDQKTCLSDCVGRHARMFPWQ